MKVEKKNIEVTFYRPGGTYVKSIELEILTRTVKDVKYVLSFLLQNQLLISNFSSFIGFLPISKFLVISH